MNKQLLLLSLIFGVAFAQLHTLKLWEDFKIKYNKEYPTQKEHDYRYKVFQSSMERSKMLQEKQPLATFGVTQFSDLTPEEFRERYLIKTPLVKPEAPVAPDLPLVDLPAEFDWNDKPGVVTPVKNQGQCGSCWAFSATEALESIWALAGHTLTKLSPQQIVDCDNTCYGCNGGWPYLAYEYIKNTGGLESEAAYPYVAYDENCAFNNQKVVAKVTGWQYVTQNQNETQMQNYIYSKSPISVCVDAQIWQTYTGGVISSGCGTSIDHCVDVTGWKVVNGIPVWNVRNSWGTSWGYSGYLYVKIGGDVCAIAQVVTVPQV